ncbi:response regulator transcription factor [Actinomycetes bacterium KLBMP 9759]
MRVLVVEDDDGVADAVGEALGTHGHAVTRAARAADVWGPLHDVDVVLLDLGLPDGDGLDVLRMLRRIATVPVIVLTARDAERDVVRGLRLGADDYLVKPVRLRELLARMEAITRRVRSTAKAGANDVVEVGDLRIDLTARRADVGGAEIALTSKEFDILAALARRSGTAVSRQQLLDEVWGDAYLAVSRSLDVHVAALRAKIDRPGLLATIRGFGFRIGG